MAQFSYGPNGEKIVHSRFTRSGVLTMKDIMPEDPKTTAKLITQKKALSGNIVKTYKTDTLSSLVRRIMFDCVTEILERAAEGDVFVFPGTTGANVSIKKTPDKEVRMLRQMGKFTEIDIVKSRFTIPRFVFDFGPKYTRKNRHIYVGRRITDIAFRNVENGNIPWTVIRKRLNYDNRTG